VPLEISVNAIQEARTRMTNTMKTNRAHPGKKSLMSPFEHLAEPTRMNRASVRSATHQLSSDVAGHAGLLFAPIDCAFQPAASRPGATSIP
jgi:hypothetical protein